MAAELTGEDYRSHVRMVYRVCFRLLRSHEEAEDAAQDTFVKFLGSRFRGESSMSTYLYAIATRICIDRFRRASRNDGFMLAWSQVQQDLQAGGDERARNLMLVVRLLENHTDTEDAALATCYYVHGMTEQEIAVAFEMKRRTVSFRLSRFVEAARQQAGTLA